MPPHEVEVPAADVRWAAEAARASLARWKNQRGYYNNRLNSHFKGKLGELAVERFLLAQNLKIDSHFRFPDREKLADIVVKLRGYAKILRLEVKTWSRDYWRELGRCIAVDQFTDLKKKADIVVWCAVDANAAMDMPAKVLLAGWSTMDEIAKASIRFTGLENMRKVENRQLAETDLREMSGLVP
ncbi:MAG: hypothetical protein LDL51_03810 [Chloroflexi bacterium]|nr:hypothetical protein [Chloroflexota bacterium]